MLYSEGNSKTFWEVCAKAWGFLVLCWYKVHEDWCLRAKSYRIQMGHNSAMLRGICRQSDWRHSERCWRTTDVRTQGRFLGEVTLLNCMLDGNTRFIVMWPLDVLRKSSWMLFGKHGRHCVNIVRRFNVEYIPRCAPHQITEARQISLFFVEHIPRCGLHEISSYML